VAWMDPNPGASQCRCPECWTLPEYLDELTGRTYGLPRARGHAPLPVEPAKEPVVIERPRVVARQPWEVRRSRYAA